MADGLLSSKDQIVLWASESTFGTDAVESDYLTGTADFYHQDVRSIDVTTVGEVLEVPRVRGSASGNKSAYAKGRCEVEMEIPLTSFITETDQVPHYGQILQACNLSEDVSVSDQSTYTPSTTRVAGATIYVYERELESGQYRLEVITGFTGSADFTFSTNAEPMLTVTGGGDYESYRDPASFVGSDGTIALLKDGTTSTSGTGAEAVADKDPLVCQGITFTVGATTHIISELNINLNWSTDQLDAVTSSQTTSKHINTRAAEGSRIGGSFNLVDYTDTVLNDLIDQAEAASEKEIIVQVDDGTDLIKFTMSNCQIGYPEKGTTGNARAFSIPYFANADWSGSVAGDNELSILYDAV